MRSKSLRQSPALVPMPMRWALLAPACLEFIVQHGKDKGYPPTEREIQRALGLSTPDYSHRLLVAMEQAGMIRRDPKVARGISIPDAEKEAQ